MLTFFFVVLAAIIFEYSNGFHDAANAIATVVSTRVLTPRKAIALAAARGNWSVIKWNAGVWPKVIVPMVTSPFAGFIFGGLLMFLLFVTLQRFTPHFIHSLF